MTGCGDKGNKELGFLFSVLGKVITSYGKAVCFFWKSFMKSTYLNYSRHFPERPHPELIDDALKM